MFILYFFFKQNFISLIIILETKLKSAFVKFKFFKTIENCNHNFKIGFDSCTVPGLINFTSKINPDSYDTCEGGRWSMYITSDMKALPCSFDNQDMRWAYDISNDTIQNAWDSNVFEDFRNHFRNSCPNCDRRSECMGGCPIVNQVVLCNRKERCNPKWRNFVCLVFWLLFCLYHHL